MMKFQIGQGYFYSVVLVISVIFSILYPDGGFKGYETGFLAGFVFLASFPFLFQMNKLNIPYNFTHHKTLHT